jgi:branched-subunit amino acid aminotransferase/4-amino-4-deoxychorismate lyase
MRKKDGRILLFRPEENALRMKMGAERLCMPSPSVEQFVEAVKQTVIANKRWVYIIYFFFSETFERADPRNQGIHNILFFLKRQV